MNNGKNNGNQHSRHLLIGLVAYAALLISVTAAAAEPERGQQLYENHCTGCHESNAHIREDRKARTQADIRTQIVRWRGVLELSWSNREVDDVLSFLNDRYYHYPADPQ